MSSPRIAFITNLCPYYRRPLYELLAEQLDTTFYFFSEGEEHYLGSALEHDPGDLPVRRPRRVMVAGHPLLVGLERDLHRENYDAVVKCINGRLMVPYVYALSRRRGLPFVLWTGIWHHPTTTAHRLTRRLTESVYRGADAIVTYGEHVKQFVEAVPGVGFEKTYVAGQAIDPAPFETLEPAFLEPPEILFIGQLEEHKGVDDLLTAFGAVDDPTVRLRLVGSGSLEGELRARAQTDPRVELLGPAPHREMPAQIERARCLVLPAVTTDRHREAWGLVVNEAMAGGVPVIATEAVGAATGGLIRDGRNGLVVPERRPEALATAIARLVTDPGLARTLGERAREDVAAFSYPRMARAFTDAVDHAVDPHASDTSPDKIASPAR